MVALGFALLIGLIGMFALGCWLDRPMAVHHTSSAEDQVVASPAPARTADPAAGTAGGQALDPSLDGLRLGNEAA